MKGWGRLEVSQGWARTLEVIFHPRHLVECEQEVRNTTFL
jgi:hypothetical protein